MGLVGYLADGLVSLVNWGHTASKSLGYDPGPEL
jgi:hypothetical protein